MCDYRIAIIGFGSIGSRHLLNIADVLNERQLSFSVDLIRSTRGSELDSRFCSLVNEVYFSYENVPDDYDVVFITNPPHLHYDTIKAFASKTRHMFIEKPVFDNANITLQELGLKKEGVYYVACPLRYTRIIQYIKSEIEPSSVFSVRVICSSYLPEWRPGVDYRRTYSADAKQGGGVSIDLIHEWDYLKYLFGLPTTMFNLRGRFSNLEISSDDLSVYIAEYDQMLVEVHLDYFGRKNIREIQLFTETDTIVGDILTNEIRYLKSGKVISFSDSRNAFQRREISYFFDILEGKEENHNDIAGAMATLRLVEEGIV